MRKLATHELGRKTAEDFRRAEKMPVIAVLENVRSAYNVGSVFRSADAFLIEAVYLVGYTAHPPHKEIAKTALGAEETVEWRHFRLFADAKAHLDAKGFDLYAVEQAENSILLQDFNPLGKKLAVLFGNEVNGVEQQSILQCRGCIEIPQLGMKHSLNIATAAGVVLWEMVKPQLLSRQKTRMEH